MHDELVRDGFGADGPVAVVEDQGMQPVFADDAHRGTVAAAQIQRVLAEPLASALGGVERVEREALLGRLR